MDIRTQHLPPGRRRRWRLPALLGGLVVASLIAAAAVLAWPVLATRDADAVAVDSPANLDALIAPAVADANGDRAFGRDGRWRLRPGEKVLAGSVASVGDGTLVVHKDGGAEVSVPTDGDTRVRGAQNRALSDLQAGERVLVKIGADGVADGVLAVRARVAGTVSKLDGDRATVIQPGGLTTVLDLSGVGERPAVGTVVIAVGTAAEDGTTLKVEEIKAS